MDGSWKVKGFPCLRRVRQDGVRVVSSLISRHAADRGVGSDLSIVPDIGARWCLMIYGGGSVSQPQSPGSVPVRVGGGYP